MPCVAEAGQFFNVAKDHFARKATGGKAGGVSERMLAQTLQLLEGDGLILRHAHQVVPPHVNDSLPPLGAEAARRVANLTQWIEASLPDILAPRATNAGD